MPENERDIDAEIQADMTRLREIERLAGELVSEVLSDHAAGCVFCASKARTLKSKIEEGKA